MDIGPIASLNPSPPVAAPRVSPDAAPAAAPSDRVDLGRSQPPSAAPPETSTAAPAAPSPAIAAPSPASAAVPATINEAQAPIDACDPQPLRLGDAALWSSLDAAGWLAGISDTAPDRLLTPPERAGLLAVADRIREKGFVLMRDFGGDDKVDIRPVDNEVLGRLLDERKQGSRWKLSFASETQGNRYGFLHSLRQVAELAYFVGAMDQPHGLAAPSAAEAIRSLVESGAVMRQQQNGKTYDPIPPERTYMLLGGARKDQNYQNWYSVQVEMPGRPPLVVHTAEQMALLHDPPAPQRCFVETHSAHPSPQTVLDAASIAADPAEAEAMLDSAARHVLPLVQAGSVPGRAVHHILSEMSRPSPGTSVSSRIELFSPLLEAFASLPAGWEGADEYNVQKALDCFGAICENARDATPGESTLHGFAEAAATRPSGLPIPQQVDIAARVTRAVDGDRRDEALTLTLVDLAREHREQVEGAVHLLQARVPLERVREGLDALAPFDGSEGARIAGLDRLAQAASQPKYVDVLEDYRTATQCSLGDVPLDDRYAHMASLLTVLSPRGEAARAREAYAYLAAAARDGRLADSEIPDCIARFASSLALGASVERALSSSLPRGTENEIVAARTRREIIARLRHDDADAPALLRELTTPAVPPLALATHLIDTVPSASASALAMTALQQAAAETSAPQTADALIRLGASPDEQLALGRAALAFLSRTEGFEEGAHLALRATDALQEPAEKRVAAVLDTLPHVAATTADDLVGLGDRVLQHARFGSAVRHEILDAVKRDPVVGANIRVGLDALGAFPKNLISFDQAARRIIDGRAISGGEAMAALGEAVYGDIYRGMNSGEGWQAARAYIEALKGDPEVGTAMWLASEICNDESLQKSDHLQIYVAEAAFSHATATTGRELASMCLAALDRCPEGSPRGAIRLSLPLFRALRRLYSDGPSRALIDGAERTVERALGVGMAFGASSDGDAEARKVARAALVQLQDTEDATTRLHRRMSEAAPAAKVEQAEEFVVVGGIRVPRRK